MYKFNKKQMQSLLALVAIAQSFPAYASPFNANSFSVNNNFGLHTSAVSVPGSASVAPVSSVSGAHNISPVIPAGANVVSSPVSLSPVSSISQPIAPVFSGGMSVVPSPSVVNP